MRYYTITLRNPRNANVIEFVTETDLSSFAKQLKRTWQNCLLDANYAQLGDHLIQIQYRPKEGDKDKFWLSTIVKAKYAVTLSETQIIDLTEDVKSLVDGKLNSVVYKGTSLGSDTTFEIAPVIPVAHGETKTEIEIANAELSHRFKLSTPELDVFITDLWRITDEDSSELSIERLISSDNVAYKITLAKETEKDMAQYKISAMSKEQTVTIAFTEDQIVKLSAAINDMRNGSEDQQYHFVSNLDGNRTTLDMSSSFIAEVPRSDCNREDIERFVYDLRHSGHFYRAL